MSNILKYVWVFVWVFLILRWCAFFALVFSLRLLIFSSNHTVGMYLMWLRSKQKQPQEDCKRLWMCICLFVCVPYWWPVTFHLRRTAQEWSCGKSDGLCYQTCVSFTTEVNKYTHTRAVVLEFFCQCWNVTCRTLPFLVMRMTCQTSERHATMKKEKKKRLLMFIYRLQCHGPLKTRFLTFTLCSLQTTKKTASWGVFCCPAFTSPCYQWTTTSAENTPSR